MLFCKIALVISFLCEIGIRLFGLYLLRGEYDASNTVYENKMRSR